LDYKEKLLEEKKRIEAMKNKRQEEFRVPLAEMTGDLSMYDQHTADLGSELFEREKDYASLELMEFELNKIEQALIRLETGVYGICEICGNEIEAARMERLPAAELCSSCARQREADGTAERLQENFDNSAEALEFGRTFTVAGYEFYEE
jgi:RNA polymerase-binding transcription factor DksA